MKDLDDATVLDQRMALSDAEQQTEILQVATGNYRKMKKLMRAWETETERIIDAEFPRTP